MGCSTFVARVLKWGGWFSVDDEGEDLSEENRHWEGSRSSGFYSQLSAGINEAHVVALSGFGHLFTVNIQCQTNPFSSHGNVYQ